MKMSTSKQVIFYAPIGNLTAGFKSGGAEAGCKKTMEVLKKGGYEILLVEKPSRGSNSKVGAIILAVRLLLIWMKLLYLFIIHRKSIFHIAGFYLNQALFEAFLVKTAYLFRVKCVYEIRNGGMIESYNSGTANYQKIMDVIFTNASVVLSQGYDYVIFLHKKYGVKSVYYPNYIMDDFISDNNISRKDVSSLKLIYFGRVVPDKNIEFILDVCKELKSNNLSISLDIIGSYELDYFERLNAQIIAQNLSDYVVFHGRMEFHRIYEYLQKSHFFIFPSKEKREGHSNSLTEAMGCGVIPIASSAGFNQSIIGDEFLIIEEFDAVIYANKILEIVNSNNWLNYSSYVYNRVIENYTESIVKSSLLDAYSKII